MQVLSMGEKSRKIEPFFVLGRIQLASSCFTCIISEHLFESNLFYFYELWLFLVN